MAKYIDADRLKAEIERRRVQHRQDYISGDITEFHRIVEDHVIVGIIDSLQQEQPKDISVPKWLLENIEDTLRIQNNINNDKKSGETCQDRNIKQALNGVRKILSGEALTGHERLEPLKPCSAEKDLALTWGDIQFIDYFILQLVNEEREGKDWGDGEKFYTEVLNRFNKSKKGK